MDRYKGLSSRRTRQRNNGELRIVGRSIFAVIDYFDLAGLTSGQSLIDSIQNIAICSLTEENASRASNQFGGGVTRDSTHGWINEYDR